MGRGLVTESGCHVGMRSAMSFLRASIRRPGNAATRRPAPHGGAPGDEAGACGSGDCVGFAGSTSAMLAIWAGCCLAGSHLTHPKRLHYFGPPPFCVRQPYAAVHVCSTHLSHQLGGGATPTFSAPRMWLTHRRRGCLRAPTIKPPGLTCERRPSSRRSRELRAVQPGVDTIAREQRLVVALLDDRTVLHHQDHVGVADRGEPVGDHE